MGTLTVRLQDEQGKALAGRLMVLAADGRYYAPDDHWLHGDDNFDRARQPQENRYFHCVDRCRVTVPAGVVRLWAMNGFARSPVELIVDIGEEGRELPFVLAAPDIAAEVR